MFNHTTVLLHEAVEGLNVKEDGIYVDCTLGGAGHSAEIIKLLSSEGQLICFDQDMTAIEAAQKNYRTIQHKYTLSMQTLKT